MDIVISSGHGKFIRGAKGYLDEVDEARRVVDRVAEILRHLGVGAVTFHDDVSKTQSENLKRIVDFHNLQTRDYDVSIHFNAFKSTSNPMGTECLYLTQPELAASLSSAMSSSGKFINRGAKKRTDLYFLNKTARPAVLLEVCFVDSSTDANLYRTNFDAICESIARVATPVNPAVTPNPEDQITSPTPIPWNQLQITATVFGGAKDPNTSAYNARKLLDDTELYVALPFKFRTSPRPKVKVWNLSRSAVGEIWDVGPWMIDDPYFNIDSRPIAEVCFETKTPLPRGPHEGKIPTNGAGIDLSPALAKAIGLEGKGLVNWEFV